MKLEMFFEYFNQFADAPDAVAKMRELIIQLAVRGKLVKQRSADGTSDELVDRITQVRKQNRNGKSIEDADAGSLSDIAGWYELPKSWRWVRLKTLGKIVGGGTPQSDNPKYFADDGIPWLTPADLNGFRGKRIDRGRRRITRAGLESSSAQLLPAGAVLFSSRAPIGYVAIAATQLTTNQGFKSCIPFIEETNEFLYYFLLSAAERIEHEASGTTFREVSGKIVGQIPVPLPPLAEQKRIVNKVDELMALCDRLEAQQKERETRHASLTRAAIARLDEAPTPANLNVLFHPSYSVTPADLRNTILNLAVQGKLISQDPDDQSVDELLAMCDRQRQETAKSDRRASTDVMSLLSADDRWDVPDSWSWRALADLVLFIDYRGKTPNKVSSGIRLITAKNVRKGELNLSPEEFLSETDYRAWMTRGLPERGDVLFTTEAPMGNVAVVELAERFGLAQRVICFRSYGSLDPSFLVLQILSDSFQLILDKNATGMTAKGIKAGKLKLLPVAVPPLAEQRRIVAKVDLLMHIVDQLENQLRASRTFSKELLDAVVYELLHPAAEVVEFPLSESDRASQRTAIGCYAVEHLKRNPSFGHTMNMKVVYMAQAHIGLPLDLKFERRAAGPWHPWIEEFDAVGQSEGWFTVTQKSIGDGRTKYEYVPKAAMKQKTAEAAAVLGEHRAEFDRLLGFFADMQTVDAEIVATLFAAWNDFLIDGNTPTDDEIIREVRENWNRSKERFTPALLLRWLDWMRSHDLIPHGHGPRTRQQLTLRLM